MHRLKNVRDMRLASDKEATRRLAQVPGVFAEVRQPESDYVLIPRHSSENRSYIPFGFFDKRSIVADSCACVPNATLYHFGVLTSSMHMAWVRTVCGRLKSDFRYSNRIVYNNYPWPENVTDTQRERVEQCAQEVLDARGTFPDSSLADLYDPLTTPPELVNAHQKLDAAVDAAYSRRQFASEMDRLTFLFDLYAKYTAPLVAKKAVKRRRKKK